MPAKKKSSARKKSVPAKKTTQKKVVTTRAAKKSKKTATGTRSASSAKKGSIRGSKGLATRAKKSTASAKSSSSYLSLFPRDFLWGTATAATQIDGGDANSDWAQFSMHPENIADGQSSLIACDHWNRYEEDFKLMKSMGLNAYRLGVDWSRMEPTEGQWDNAGLDHFRGMLQSLKKKGIRPMLTLNHFVLPQWWLARGGWEQEKNLPAFYEFSARMVENVGDLVEDYTILNEPNVYAVFAYMEGIWPPGRKGLSGYFKSMKVLRNMALAQGKVYDLIHEIHARKGFANPTVGMAKHVRIFDPARPDNKLDQDRAKEAEYRFNTMWTDAIHTGILDGSLGKKEKFHDGPCWDFIGLNYYSRDMVRFSVSAISRLFIDREEPTGVPTNDLGWEIYPEGLYRLIKDFYGRYDLPIRITENGIADAQDNRREAFLVSHLQQVARCLQEGIPLEGYYHWSFMDNFEWAEGYAPRFGLVHVDYATQKRSLRESGKAYKKMIASARKSGR